MPPTVKGPTCHAVGSVDRRTAVTPPSLCSKGSVEVISNQPPEGRDATWQDGARAVPRPEYGNPRRDRLGAGGASDRPGPPRRPGSTGVGLLGGYVSGARAKLGLPSGTIRSIGECLGGAESERCTGPGCESGQLHQSAPSACCCVPRSSLYTYRRLSSDLVVWKRTTKGRKPPRIKYTPRISNAPANVLVAGAAHPLTGALTAPYLGAPDDSDVLEPSRVQMHGEGWSKRGEAVHA